jgi:hypothetical protein
MVPGIQFSTYPRKCKYANLQQICTSDLLHIHKFLQNLNYSQIRRGDTNQCQNSVKGTQACDIRALGQKRSNIYGWGFIL